jgi:hypothetical protein
VLRKRTLCMECGIPVQSFVEKAVISRGTVLDLLIRRSGRIVQGRPVGTPHDED